MRTIPIGCVVLSIVRNVFQSVATLSPLSSLFILGRTSSAAIMQRNLPSLASVFGSNVQCNLWRIYIYIYIRIYIYILYVYVSCR